jgi:hypothetical protein
MELVREREDVRGTQHAVAARRLDVVKDISLVTAGGAAGVRAQGEPEDVEVGHRWILPSTFVNSSESHSPQETGRANR